MRLLARVLQCTVVLIATLVTAAAAERPRLLVMTDIGGDPDDQQSMVRLMAYANEFRIEGLIATSAGIPGQLKVPTTRPDLIREIVSAYGQVRPKLLRHADGWPSKDELDACIRSGNVRRGREAIGDGQDTEGSRRIVERIEAGTPADPLNVTIWGGQTDLAQALWRVKHDRGEAGLSECVRKLRVYDIDDQDRLASWIHDEFPGMFYILSRAPAGIDNKRGTYRGMYLGGDDALTTRAWVDDNVRRRGALGACYPVIVWTGSHANRALKEGDTPSWFFFLSLGGNDPSDPTKPGWGGQYRRSEDGWYRDLPITPEFDPRTTVSRWRPAFQADFSRRMAWCVE